MISVRGLLPIGGINERYSITGENDILGICGKLSYIRGFGSYKLGPYTGFSLSDLDAPGFTLGFDYKSYLNIPLSKPIALGAQFELNFSEYEQKLHINLVSFWTDRVSF